MALINTIREKSGWAVGAIVIGLLLFMVGGDLFTGQNSFFGRSDRSVGEIAGQEIDYDEFNATLEQAKQAFIQQQGRQPDEQAMGYLREQAWNQMLYRIAFQKQFEKLGLTVSDDEIYEMVQGNNPNNLHPSIRQAFTDSTGQFDRVKLQNYLRNLDKDPQAQAIFTNFEQNLRPERLGQKYTNMLKMSTYVTSAEAKRFNEGLQAQMNLRYLFVPYFALSDSSVKVTDEQLQAYIDKNQGRFKVEDGRSIEYVSIPVTASVEDSTEIGKTVNELATQFAAAPADSVFVKLNSDNPVAPAYLTAADMPEKLRAQLPLQEGKVYGPYTENGTYSLYKVTGQKTGDQSAARASHILIKSEGTTPEADAAAKAKATEVLGKIKGGADFAAMARQYGSDGTTATGGDLGWFQQGRMVPEFEKAVFGASSLGLLPNLVKTSFGYHIIKVTAAPTKQTYRVATVQKSIQPTEGTRDAAYNKAQELKGRSIDLESFRKAVAADKSLQKAEAKNLGRGDQAVNNLQDARPLVRWAYGADDSEGAGAKKVGDVSRVFEIGDTYVVAVLTGERSKGTADLASIKPEITALVRNELKAEQIKQKLSASKGTLEQMAQAYGPAAQVKTADNVVLGQGMIAGVGSEPTAVGRAFGLKAGQKSAPIAGEQGVFVVEPTSMQPAPPTTDVAAARQQLTTQRAARIDGLIFEALKQNADVKDNRAKFF
ncbi:peptidylprolyl isomerase [Hymenobacter lapidiphilus]|uniref:peptidylprolyl isomerase n=1 Tax=Hymenobacter sp. CCM 8763 TaxID=2303334 RepID=UPI001F5B73BD|nr:peptidylprolyl isomerase [Hymenobacter sp. CCM 8763]